MIKLCYVAIFNPLYLIYKNSYSISWKKGIVLPIHKKKTDSWRKTTGLFNFYLFVGEYLKNWFSMLYITCENQLLTPSQSVFRPNSNSTVNQLLSIMHKIYSAFKEFPSRERRAIFLDISKAFGKVWHDGFLFKLESYGISDCLFTLMKKSPATQGSVLGPLFFLGTHKRPSRQYKFWGQIICWCRWHVSIHSCLWRWCCHWWIKSIQVIFSKKK